jgi:hypothetical protein
MQILLPSWSAGDVNLGEQPINILLSVKIEHLILFLVKI